MAFHSRLQGTLVFFECPKILTFKKYLFFLQAKLYDLNFEGRMTNDNSAAVFFTIGTSANGKMIGFRMQNGSTAYLLYHYGGDYLTTPTTFGESQQWRHVAATYGGGFQQSDCKLPNLQTSHHYDFLATQPGVCQRDLPSSAKPR